MKLIVAVVRPFTIDRILVAFEGIENFPGMTVTDTLGFGQGLKTPGDEINPFKPNKWLEIVSPEEMVDEIISVLRVSAHTGKKGDGFIIVLPIEKSVLI